MKTLTGFVFLIAAAGLYNPATAQAVSGQKESSSSELEQVCAVVDVTRTCEPVHPYVYGMFTELLFNIFEKGLWAEMLSDRKFFYAVDTTSTLNPVNTRPFQNRWRPVGGIDGVTLEHDHAYTGEHSPMIRLSGTAPYGIIQAGMPLRKGRSYSGHIVMSGDSGVSVTVSLIWGSGAEDRQTVSLNALTPGYKKFPFYFTSGNDTENGQLEVTGTGTGSFQIGAVSLMPADNRKGYRADIINLLKELHSGIYRWPGGNFVAGYNWRDGIGDRDTRPPRYDYAWNAVESNDVGTDEYLTLCDLVDIDPYICVNIGFGDDFSAAQWVEYVNGAKDTPMGMLRAQNGHSEPYKVQWWGIGNEMYGQWQLGHMSIDHYIIKHNMFAAAMRKVDPSIKLVASGATPFETSTTARYHRVPLPSKLPYQYGSPEDWTGNLLAYASGNIDFVSEHMYPFTDHAFNIDSQKFVPSNDPLIDQIRRLPNRVKAVAEAWDEYQKSIPGLKDKKITFAIDEWTGGSWDNECERTLFAAEGLHEIFRHSDIITMGGYTAVTSCINFNATDACYSSIGLLFKLYRQHFGTIPLEISGNSPQHPVKGTVGVDKPAKSSGSDTWPLDVMAAMTEDRKKVTVAVVNPTETEQEMVLNFTGAAFQKGAKEYRIAFPDRMARNIPGKDPEVTVQESVLKKIQEKIQAVPLSISLYEFVIK